MHRAINPRPHQLPTQNLSSIFMNSEKFDNVMHPDKRVGFIGLGLMGGGMAMNILKKHGRIRQILRIRTGHDSQHVALFPLASLFTKRPKVPLQAKTSKRLNYYSFNSVWL